MEKDKNKQTKPEPQGWDKTARNFQRTANEEDVRGEMGMRKDNRQDDKKKQDKKDEKKDTF